MTVEDESLRCGREDAVGVPVTGIHGGRFVAVRCIRPKGHHGAHVFIHTWRDPRDQRGKPYDQDCESRP